MRLLVLTLLLVSCHHYRTQPALFNRVAEVKKPKARSTYWEDVCIREDGRPICIKFVTPYFGTMRCGCCPRGYTDWECGQFW